MSVDQALDLIRAKRPVIRPNIGKNWFKFLANLL